MITNRVITYYHKILNNTTHLEEWSKIVFDKVWLFGGKGASINKGYENANDVDIRIPMEYVQDTTIFKVGDIVVAGEHEDIERQSDLKDVEFYNITSVNVNDFGNNPHVHLGGK